MVFPLQSDEVVCVSSAVASGVREEVAFAFLGVRAGVGAVVDELGVVVGEDGLRFSGEHAVVFGLDTAVLRVVLFPVHISSRWWER
jgi:hypothetical protein